MDSKSITSNGFDLRLAYREPARPGDLPPLIFLHGAWHGAWCWEAFLDYFTARGHVCATVDLAGHGDAGRPRDYNLRPVSRHLPALRAAVADVSRRGRPFLIAHSMGGWLAQMLLAGTPAVDVAGTVLVTPVPPGGLPIATSFKVFREHPVKFFRTSLLQSFSVDNPRMARKLFHETGKPEREVRDAMARLRPESAMACFDMIFGFSRVSPGKIAGKPILLLAAEHDYFFPPRCESLAAARLGADYLEFKGMAHNLMEDQRWEEVAAAIQGWIDAAARNAA